MKKVGTTISGHSYSVRHELFKLFSCAGQQHPHAVDADIKFLRNLLVGLLQYVFHLQNPPVFLVELGPSLADRLHHLDQFQMLQRVIRRSRRVQRVNRLVKGKLRYPLVISYVVSRGVAGGADDIVDQLISAEGAQQWDLVDQTNQ